jgi:hypothetical protein
MKFGRVGECSNNLREVFGVRQHSKTLPRDFCRYRPAKSEFTVGTFNSDNRR